jgi:hypothetical protein
MLKQPREVYNLPVVNLNPETHEQVWIKVNAPVDRGIARVVSLLSEFQCLHTLDSCEGIEGGKPAHVYFNCGDWRELGHLLFDQIGPALWRRFGNDAVVSLEIFNDSRPMGKLSFDNEATDVVASVLDSLVHDRP